MTRPLYHRQSVLVCAAFFTLGTFSAAVAAEYSVVDLGTLTNPPGGTEARPNAINQSGWIAAANGSGSFYQALLYGGTWSNLGTLGGSAAYAAGLNDSWQVVGYSTLSSGARRAFLWTPGGTDGVAGNPQMKSLGTLGGAASEAYSINSGGQITGYSQTADRDHVFRYSGGVMTDLGGLVGSSRHSYGFDINDGGQIAGTAYNSSYSASFAFLYNGTTVVPIPGWDDGNSTALAINNSGRIAGYANTITGAEHAFRYANGALTDLGTLGGGFSYAVNLNNNDVVVGGSFVDGANSTSHAFKTAGNLLVDLNTLTDSTGAGWVLTEARAINDAGQIVGVGRRNNTTRAFLLNPLAPPPPASTITRLRVEGADVLISYTTVASAQYVVEVRAPVGAGIWSEINTAVPGTGGEMTVTNHGGLAWPDRYYRVKTLGP